MDWHNLYIAMTYELALKLKNAGFPQTARGPMYFCTDLGEWTYSLNCDPYSKAKCETHEMIKCPTLSELIEACGDDFCCLEKIGIQDWICYRSEEERNNDDFHMGHSPGEAVAMLWIDLNKK